MIPIKNDIEIQAMREACKIAATVLNRLCLVVEAGMNTYDLDQLAKKYIEGFGAKSACYNYKVGSRRFPAYTCISVNEEVIHGIGSLSRVLEEGDIVTFDVCVSYNGFIGDNARTVLIGPVATEVAELVQVTEKALYHGIGLARPLKRIGDISFAIQQHVESSGFSVVRDFVGHGVGRSMHEEPQIPNFGRKHTGPKLKPGMTLAIEPMVNSGSSEVKYGPDGWTALACDGKPTAHFEHTVLITEGEAEILTIPEE